jgi:hypothetical protein
VLGCALARDDEREKKRGARRLWGTLYRHNMAGGWGMGRGRHHMAARRGGSAAVVRRGVAGSGPAATLVGGARAGGT